MFFTATRRNILCIKSSKISVAEPATDTILEGIKSKSKLLSKIQGYPRLHDFTLEETESLITYWLTTNDPLFDAMSINLMRTAGAQITQD